MKRDVSTSTIGRDEARKPLLAAYMFQRRLLFGCSILFCISLILWIVAIASDHWTIISGGTGIFIPETRRFFMSSHSGLWRICRYTITPNAQPSARVVRNFTSFAYPTANLVFDARANASAMEYVKEFSNLDVQFPLSNFTEDAKKRMFAHWVKGDKAESELFKNAFHNLVLSTKESHDDIIPIDSEPIKVNPLNVDALIQRNVFGETLKTIIVNGTSYYFVIPEPLQKALFEDWNNKRYVPQLLLHYSRFLGVPAYVLNDDRKILQLVPPLPPKKGRGTLGYDYISNTRCKYIEMFHADGTSDAAFNEELMDYIRTQASFACITVFVMSLGAVFSFYTFMNPRYMFKRLAGGIHLVAASTALVVIQVLMSSIDYTKTHISYAYPAGAELRYGYGVYLAWFTFGCNIVCGLLFLWYSGKKKGAKAPTDEIAMADEPTIMGR